MTKPARHLRLVGGELPPPVQLEVPKPAVAPSDGSWATSSNLLTYCGQARDIFKVPGGGVTTRTSWCRGSWDCDRHGPKRAAVSLAKLAEYWGELPSVWWAQARWSSPLAASLRQRATYARTRHGVDAERMAVVYRGRAWLFASVDLSGRNGPPFAEATPQTALVVARRALAVPRPLRVHLSPGWPLPVEEDRERVVKGGRLGRTFAATEQAWEMVAERHGVKRSTVGDDRPPPRGWSQATLEERFMAAVKEIEGVASLGTKA